MAWQRAVIVAAHGGLTEIVRNEENGLLFRPSDANDLAAKLGLLLNNREILMCLAMRGREDVERRFSPETHVRLVTAVYERLM